MLHFAKHLQKPFKYYSSNEKRYKIKIGFFVEYVLFHLYNECRSKRGYSLIRIFQKKKPRENLGQTDPSVFSLIGVTKCEQSKYSLSIVLFLSLIYPCSTPPSSFSSDLWHGMHLNLSLIAI